MPQTEQENAKPILPVNLNLQRFQCKAIVSSYRFTALQPVVGPRKNSNHWAVDPRSGRCM